MLYIHVLNRKQSVYIGLRHSKTLHGSLSCPFAYIWVYYYVSFLKYNIHGSPDDIKAKKVLGKRMKQAPLGNQVQTSYRACLFIAMTARSVDTTQTLRGILWNVFRSVSTKMQLWSEGSSVQKKPAIGFDLAWSTSPELPKNLCCT